MMIQRYNEYFLSYFLLLLSEKYPYNTRKIPIITNSAVTTPIPINKDNIIATNIIDIPKSISFT